MIRKFLQNHPYDIVHIHYTTPLRAPYLKEIKKAGASTRIYHAHSAFVSGKSKIKYLVYAYMRKKISKYATDYFACSKAAGEWIFENRLVSNGKVKVIYNGLEIDRFTFDEKKRNSLRAELGVDNKFVLVHTGRFTEQKNQMFLVGVFSELHKKNPDCYLLLLGDGPLKDDVKSRVEELNLNDSVLFLGVKNNVQDYLFAADCYVMPSLYEGLPVAGVEAQCSGLPCVMSNLITEEVAITDNVTFLDLNESISVWCDEILKCKSIERKDQTKVIREQGYDIDEIADRMQRFYMTGDWT
jgi:glycosyltransferase involved in cell wall biosynthesis